MVFPSASDRTSISLPNGHTSPPADHALSDAGDVAMTDSESELSDPSDAEVASEPASPQASSSDQNSPRSVDNDGDSEMEDAGNVSPASVQSENSSSEASPNGVKRKSPVDEDQYIRDNPDLYGLRRSGRARSSRQIIQTTSGSDSDAVASRPKRRRQVSQRSSKRPSRSAASSDEESEDDEYGGAKARAGKAKRRRLMQSGSSVEPLHGEIRFSTRRAARVSNYNEDEGDDDIFEDDSAQYQAEYYAQPDENIPAIDSVLNHRLKADADTPRADLGRKDFEYYIKWQGKSHYHATWETVESLMNCRSTRRLDNYVRKILAQELLFVQDDQLAPEDKEKWNLDRERDTDAIEDYKRAERVIGSREVDGETEYLVKWKRLFYDSSTWEAADLVSEIAQPEIDRYLDRCSRPPVSNKAESNLASRAPFEPIHGTPEYVRNGELKDFQVKGVNFMAYNWVRGRNVVLADEMGLGKTVQTVAFINWLRHVRQQQGPFIVVVPLSTMPSWAETFDNWTPDLNYVVYSGNEPSRKIIRDFELFTDGNLLRPSFNVLLTTYEYVLADASFLSQVKWQFMAVDEAHRLKNRDSQLYAKLVEFKSPSRLLITGTPVQNSLGELSALMDFLNPGSVNIDDDMDLSSEAASMQLAELTKAIQPYMLRRTKAKVETELPSKTEKIIRVELSDVQLEYYKNILTKNYAALNQGATGQKQSLLNIMMELKKASNHPFMFPNAESRILNGSDRREDILRAMITSSGKMMLLDQLLAKLKKDGHRVLIFSQMVKMLDILGDYMDYRGYTYQRLDGTIAAAPRRLAIEHYNAPDSSDFAFILSTRAGGLGINLMTADTVILFDSDWNPQADLQAMARAHRIGQTKPVSVYRLVSKDTVEEEVLERARNKLVLEYITIQRGVTDKENTEIKDRINFVSNQVTEPSSSDDISRILKRRGQKMFEQSGNQKKLEELDIDTVLANAEEHKTEQAESIQADGGEEFLKAFEFVDVKVDELTWDEIIPKEQLDDIKAEEKKKEDEKYLAQVIKENQPRKRNAPVSDGREERQAKRQARVHVSADSDNQSEPAPTLDPMRPLVEKEYRHLVRAFLRYGDIEDREDDLIKEARLIGRDKGVVREGLRQITEKAATLQREENERLEVLENEGKVFTKKERKAVLFDHNGVKRLNAETIVERPGEMRLLKQVTDAVSDPKSFRIPEATKGADYTCDWGAREDGMLCVGISRHGYGAWAQIRDDPDLALADKFFLEEHRVGKKNERQTESEQGPKSKTTKSPGAVHLVRRADYLLSVLKDKMSNGTSLAAKRAVENHHRNNKKNGMQARQTTTASVSASPVPQPPRKHRESDKMRHRGGQCDSVESRNTPRPDARQKAQGGDKARVKGTQDGDSDRRRSNDLGGGNARDDTVMKIVFKPIREHLKRVSNVTKETFPGKVERAAQLRTLLRKIGDFIRGTLEGEESGSSLEARLWDHAATYWPNTTTPGHALQLMFDRLLAAEAEKLKKDQENGTSEPAKEPKEEPTENPKPKKEPKE
ncbi:hypothetical protein FQN54_003919 [Arachnomyces sp. PD_36]|nr:hypothetical protein FQN54_003919 [Arachnomyces sp. PD_36]